MAWSHGLHALSVTFSLWRLWLRLATKANMVSHPSLVTPHATRHAVSHDDWLADEMLVIGPKTEYCHQESHRDVKLTWPSLLFMRHTKIHIVSLRHHQSSLQSHVTCLLYAWAYFAT